MAFKFKVRDTATDTLEIFLESITTDVETVKKQTLKKSGEAIKKEVIKALPRTSKQFNQRSYGGEYHYSEHIHMQDDVKVILDMQGLYGDQVRVRGGKHTGTLWHLLNDGTSVAKATHFMDTAQDNAQPKIEQIFENEMGAKFS